MSYHDKKKKPLILFLIIFHSILNSQCHATRNADKCTCEFEGGDLCQLCLKDFSFYIPRQQIDQVDVLDIPSKLIESKSENVERCEKWEEDISQVYKDDVLDIPSERKSESVEPCGKCEEYINQVYQIGKNKLCTNCALAHLSFYFPRQKIDDIKSYCAEIIFSVIQKNELQTKTKFAIDELVDKKFNKELKLLKQIKDQNKSFNFILFVNSILVPLEQDLMYKRKCQLCPKSPFHLMKVPCCEKFICLNCVLVSLFRTDSPKCQMCGNKYISCNVEQFAKIFKSLCVAILEICSLKITQEKDEEWENVTRKKFANNRTMRVQYKTFAELLEKHEGKNIDMIRRNYLLNPDQKKVKKAYLTNGDFIVAFITSSLEMFFSPCRSNNSFWWIALNTLLTQIIASIHASFTGYETLSKEINRKIMLTNTLFVKFFLSWINFLFVAFYYYGPDFCEDLSKVLWIFGFTPLVCWISRKVSNYIHSSAVHESLYEFY